MISFAVYCTIGAIVATIALLCVRIYAPEAYDELCERRVKGVLVMYWWTLLWPVVVIGTIISGLHKREQ